MTNQPLSDPREIRKLLIDIGYRGGRIDGADRLNGPSMASTIVSTMRHLAQHQGLSGEDHMTLLAYHALLGYEKAMDMVLEEAMTRSAASLFVDPSKVGP